MSDLMGGQTYRIALILSSVILMAFANASYLNIVGPVSGTLYNNGTLYLGKVAPGQSFYISASPTTTNASGYAINIGWDKLEAVSLPQGWASQSSPLYENPMKMKVTVSPTAADGTYKLTVRSVDVQNYSKLGNLTINAYVNVTPQVFNVSVSPLSINTGIGQPTPISITINNTGISDDPFIISASGLPAWNQTAQVISLHSTSNTFSYPVYVNEPGSYAFNLTVNSSSSQQVRKTFKINLVAQATLLNDYSAISQGAILSPVVFAPPYSIMALIAYLYKTYVSR